MEAGNVYTLGPEARAELEKLRLERSDTNPFVSKLEFDVWADKVKALLANDVAARRQFANHWATAETAYAFHSDPLGAINNAIGTVNQILMSRPDVSPKAKEGAEAVEVREQSREDKQPNSAAKRILKGIATWLQKLIGTTLSKVVAGLILAGLYLVIKDHFGITLGR
jgi:hypothetical protein